MGGGLGFSIWGLGQKHGVWDPKQLHCSSHLERLRSVLFLFSVSDFEFWV